VAGDGIYSGTYMPTTLDTMSLVFPGNDVVTVQILESYNCTTPSPNGGCTNGAVAFSYRNIAGPGEHNLDLGDEGSKPVTLPFPIPFGNLSFNTITVNANGNLSLSGTPGGFDNAPLPDAFEDTLVAPWWDDLSQSWAPHRMFSGTYWDRALREFVVEWRDVPHFGTSTMDYPNPSSSGGFFRSRTTFCSITRIRPSGQPVALWRHRRGTRPVGVQVAFDTAKQFRLNNSISPAKAIL
jgi:hypothetical protein